MRSSLLDRTDSITLTSILNGLKGKLSDIEARISALDYRESNIAGAEKINSDRKVELDSREGNLTVKEISLSKLINKYQEDKAKLDSATSTYLEMRKQLESDYKKLDDGAKALVEDRAKLAVSNTDLASRERDYQAKLADIQVREQVVKTKEKSFQITP